MSKLVSLITLLEKDKSKLTQDYAAYKERLSYFDKIKQSLTIIQIKKINQMINDLNAIKHLITTLNRCKNDETKSANSVYDAEAIINDNAYLKRTYLNQFNELTFELLNSEAETNNFFNNNNKQSPFRTTAESKKTAQKYPPTQRHPYINSASIQIPKFNKMSPQKGDQKKYRHRHFFILVGKEIEYPSTNTRKARKNKQNTYIANIQSDNLNSRDFIQARCHHEAVRERDYIYQYLLTRQHGVLNQQNLSTGFLEYRLATMLDIYQSAGEQNGVNENKLNHLAKKTDRYLKNKESLNMAQLITHVEHFHNELTFYLNRINLNLDPDKKSLYLNEINHIKAIDSPEKERECLGLPIPKQTAMDRL